MIILNFNFLEEFIENKEKKEMNGVLQKFIEPSGDYNGF